MAKCVAQILGEGIKGILKFEQAQESVPTIIDGEIRGLTPGKHGLHVHIFGDFSQNFHAAAGIFNPFGKAHGGPDDEDRMVGDLGNIEANEEGIAYVHLEDRLLKLIGPHSVIGRSIIVKAGEDDLGKGGHELSSTTGNSGARIAGGVIGIGQS